MCGEYLMADFKILNENKSEELEKQVNKHLDSGYRVINCSYVSHGNWAAFMIKE